MALTSDACHKGLPKSPTGEIPQFKGKLTLVNHGYHGSFATATVTCLVVVGEDQACDETLAPGAAVAAGTRLPPLGVPGWERSCSRLMAAEHCECSWSGSLLAQPGCRDHLWPQAKSNQQT